MSKIKTYAWYFPNWHQTPLNDKWHGKGWTEWQCVKYATPRFEGHLQPKKPLWGYEDESDPVVFEKKIKTLNDYGIDGFIFDYYWFKEEGPYRRDCIDKGFLGAKNCDKCEFAVMWCNHDPIYVHPAAYRKENRVLASGDIDEAFMDEVTDYCIENYFCRDNYIRVDGKILFGIWNMAKFADNFGGFDNAGKIIKKFREKAKSKGYEIHLATERRTFPGFREKDKELTEKAIEALTIDSIFCYSWTCPKTDVWPVIEYSQFREANIQTIEQDNEYCSVPFSVNMSTGWDSSPRTVQSDIYAEDAGYPYNPITVNNTPEEIEISFREMKKFIESDKHKGKFFTLSTWNEWTEGNYFEPDELYGYGYLEAFKKVFVDEK